MNKMNQSLKFIGRGSAFNIKEENTSAYIKNDNTLLLIDCGETTFKNILKLNLLDNVENIYVLITHLHSDHVGSLSSLIYYCYNLDINVKIFAYRIDDFEKFMMLQGNLKYNTYDLFNIGYMDRDDIPELGIKNISAIKCNHCEVILKSEEFINDKLYSFSQRNLLPACGYLIEFVDESLLYYSGDTCEINREILEDYLLDKDEDIIIYQDVSLNHNKAHLSLEELDKVIPKQLRDKVYCMHLDDDRLEERLIELGFNVVKTEFDANKIQENKKQEESEVMQDINEIIEDIFTLFYDKKSGDFKVLISPKFCEKYGLTEDIVYKNLDYKSINKIIDNLVKIIQGSKSNIYS